MNPALLITKKMEAMKQELMDEEFIKLYRQFKKTKSGKGKSDIFKKMIKITGVSFDLLMGLANEFRVLKQTEFSQLLGEHLLTKPDDLTNKNLQIIIHCIAPLRQQAAKILENRPNLTDDDRAYLSPDMWLELDKLTKPKNCLSTIS
jgi:hypothetical protein